MAKKTNIALIAGGGLVLAYIIMQKKAATNVAPVATVPNLTPSSLLSQGVSFISNLFNPAPSAAQNAAAANPNSFQTVEPATPVMSPAAQLTSLPLTTPSLDITAPAAVDNSGSSIAGLPALGPGLMAAVGCVGLAACMPKKTVGAFDYNKLIIPGAIAIGAFVLIKNFLNPAGGSIFSSSANNTNNAAIDQSTQAANQALAASAVKAGITGTLGSANIASLAADIWNQGSNGGWPLPDAQQAQILQDISACRNLTDWANLKLAFGTKQATADYWSTCNFLGFNCQSYDLDAFIKATCSTQTVAQINASLAANNINYQL